MCVPLLSPPHVCIRVYACVRADVREQAINCSATAQRWSYRNDGDDAKGSSSPKKCFKTNMAAT